MSDRCKTLIMEPESMSRLPFGIVWASDLWASLIGDLLRKPMYQLGLGHSTLIPPYERRLRVIGCGGKEGRKFWTKTLTLNPDFYDNRLQL
ncbi:MAG: hypothetical protein WAK31_14710 [Chthoniobacterales bacterium]